MARPRRGSAAATDASSRQQATPDRHGSRNLRAAQARLVRISSSVRIVLVALLVLLSHLQQAFDTSHHLLSYSLDPQTYHQLAAGGFKWALAFVRWDTVYFLAAASPGSHSLSVHTGGYVWEQTLAFQPGIVALLRISGYLTPQLDGVWSPTCAILVTTLLANLAAGLSPILLHRLTLRTTRNAQLAYTAAVLSIFAPSAGTTLASPTPESFFSFASLAGLVCIQGSLSWLAILGASFWFAIATSFRANGTLLVGYLAFKLMGEARSGRVASSVLKLLLSAVVCLTPNVLFQVWAYGRFCLHDGRPWCKEPIPSVYTFVQSHYWNVGAFRYWQVAQLPNFLLAAPVLLTIVVTAGIYYRRESWHQVGASLIPSATLAAVDGGLAFDSTPEATPYIVHALALAALLAVASHVQIALRLATPGAIPALWWGASHLVLHSRKRWMRPLIVGYLSMQLCASMVLYAGFYPPA